MRWTLLIGIALLLAGCGRAAPGIGADPAFEALDADGDGELSLAESGMASLGFAQLDANGDGFIDPLEWIANPDVPGAVARMQDNQAQQHPSPGPPTGSTLADGQ